MMPARLTSPTVGLTVTTPFWVAGDKSEPEVSVPIAAAASPAATATADPELDPPGSDDRHALVVELGRVGVLHLAAQRTVAGRHVDRQDVGEFGQIGLAENYRTGPSQLLDQRRVPLRPRIGERQRAGGRMLRIGGGDVVLDQDRDTFERPAPSGLACVERGGDRERFGVYLAHRVEARAATVISLDTRQIGAH